MAREDPTISFLLDLYNILQDTLKTRPLGFFWRVVELLKEITKIFQQILDSHKFWLDLNDSLRTSHHKL